jgi:hypothetical protein
MYYSVSHIAHCLIVAVLVFLPGIAVKPAKAATGRCFPETEQCVHEAFRMYWEQQGGLPVFGFATSAARPETHRDTAAQHLTQWFERNRLEHHPQNAEPYTILLGRLGEDRLLQLGVSWQMLPRASGPKSGCLWFEQTRHTLCNQEGSVGFKTYWETHGLRSPGLSSYEQSLALFGLPLTEPRMEKNASGDTVLTQWFERARFEYHPANQQPYKVLLGLLGNEVRGSNGGGSGGGVPPICNASLVGTKVNGSLDPSFCIVWKDDFSDEHKFRIVLSYPRGKEQFTYEAGKNVSQLFVPAADAPRLSESPELCHRRKELTVEVYAVRPGTETLVGGFAVQTEC